MSPNSGKRRRASTQRASASEEEPSTRPNDGFEAGSTPPTKRVRLNDNKKKDAMACMVMDMEVEEDASEPAKAKHTCIVSFGVFVYLNTSFRPESPSSIFELQMG